ncbi:MAG: hypothetical protein C5B53_05855 [Candidatus Melainabacteria bacterium]|nr:MAG: hypothetical protein C5B53_05855 [Candidatus Melainabacteria bacterium]
MKNLIMTAVAVSVLTMATAPVFAAKAPTGASKVPVASNIKSKSMKVAGKPALKTKAPLVGIKKTK